MQGDKVVDSTGEYTTALYILAGMLLVSTLLPLALRIVRRDLLIALTRGGRIDAHRADGGSRDMGMARRASASQTKAGRSSTKMWAILRLGSGNPSRSVAIIQGNVSRGARVRVMTAQGASVRG